MSRSWRAGKAGRPVALGGMPHHGIQRVAIMLLRTLNPCPVNQPDVFLLVERRAAVKRAVVVPYQQVARSPLVAVDKTLLRDKLDQFLDELKSSRIGDPQYSFATAKTWPQG